MGRAAWRRRKTALLIAVAFLAAGLGVVVYATHLFRRTELQTIDARFSIRGTQRTPSDIVLVQIDRPERFRNSAASLPLSASLRGARDRSPS